MLLLRFFRWLCEKRWRGRWQFWLAFVALLLPSACLTPFPERSGWPCIKDKNCGEGLSCVSNRCVSSRSVADGSPGREKVPEFPMDGSDKVVLTRIAGEGTEKSVQVPAGGSLPEGARVSPRRFQRMWIFEGKNLMKLERCTIKKTTSPTVSIDFKFEDGGTNLMRKVDLTKLKPALVAGMFALTCWVGGATQSFGQVYVLQGESGTGLEKAQAEQLTAALKYLAELRKYLEVKTEGKGGRLTVRKANLHIEASEPNASTEQTNGLGNLIVGYNEKKQGVNYTRAGSHNIIVGKHHEYTSHSGLVTGEAHKLSGAGAAVLGGKSNSASGEGATVTGGENNQATGNFSSVLGGQSNVAEGTQSVVVGGGGSSSANIAKGTLAVVVGGGNNNALGNSSVVLGGGGKASNQVNQAIGEFSTILGGSMNTIGEVSEPSQGKFSTIVGGRNHKLVGENSVLIGGDGQYLTSKNSVCFPTAVCN